MGSKGKLQRAYLRALLYLGLSIVMCASGPSSDGHELAVKIKHTTIHDGDLSSVSQRSTAFTVMCYAFFRQSETPSERHASAITRVEPRVSFSQNVMWRIISIRLVIAVASEARQRGVRDT